MRSVPVVGYSVFTEVCVVGRSVSGSRRCGVAAVGGQEGLGRAGSVDRSVQGGLRKVGGVRGVGVAGFRGSGTRIGLDALAAEDFFAIPGVNGKMFLAGLVVALVWWLVWLWVWVGTWFGLLLVFHTVRD